MRKGLLSIPLLFLFLQVSAQQIPTTNDFADYVNPLMGTDSKPTLSNGNTYPAIGLPWGMNLWTPQTGRMGNGWAYHKCRSF